MLFVISVMVLVFGFILLISGVVDKSDWRLYLGFGLMSIPTVVWFQVARTYI